MINSLIHHLGIGLQDPQAAESFYDDYYAIFFQAPENLKLELVHLTESDRAKPL